MIALGVVVVALVTSRIHQPFDRRGKVAAFFALFLLPLVLAGAGVSAHLEHAKSTEFCLSCHVMEPYGESLQVADESYVPAAHFQNHWVPPERACFTCHTQYTMFGGFKAKMQGLQHVWVYYLGEVAEPIELYEPYQNRECLSCHGGARRFEAEELHAEIREELTSGETSCLDCHGPFHDVLEVADLPKWESPGGSR